MVFWVVIPCSYIVGYHHLGGPYCCHLQDADHDLNLHYCESFISCIKYLCREALHPEDGDGTVL